MSKPKISKDYQEHLDYLNGWIPFRDRLPKEGKTVIILREVSIGRVRRFEIRNCSS
jgi:hypothetical protein